MNPLVKVLAVIEATVLLGGVSFWTVKRAFPKKTASPISRPAMMSFAPKVIDTAKAWTVLISNEGFGQKYRGTGMLLDETHVLTADHMVSKNGNEMWVYVFPGRRVIHGKAIAEDSGNDLAILELDEKVQLSTYAVFQEVHHDGESIIIIGNILGGMQWYVSYGILSGEWASYLLMDGTMTHGDSGGPWINNRGEVVGLSDWQLGDEEPEASIKGGVSAKTINRFLQRNRPVVIPMHNNTYVVEQSDPTQHRRQR